MTLRRKGNLPIFKIVQPYWNGGDSTLCIFLTNIFPKAFEIDTFNAVVFDDHTEEALLRPCRIPSQRLKNLVY